MAITYAIWKGFIVTESCRAISVERRGESGYVLFYTWDRMFIYVLYIAQARAGMRQPLETHIHQASICIKLIIIAVLWK